MNRKDVAVFEKTQAQLEGLYNETSTLAKKSPNDAVNKFKLKFINQVLKETNLVLGNSYKPFNNFECFNEDDLPTNSDITLILSQYLGCLEKLRADNIVCDVGWVWLVNKKESDIDTAPPKKIKEK